MMSDQPTGAESRKWKKGLFRLIMVTALAPALYWAYWDTLGNRFRTVCPTDGVYQSAMLPPAALAKAVRTRNIRSVVDLRSEPSSFPPADERRVLTDLDVRYFHLPSPQVPALATVDKFLELSSDPDNYPMLIHCRHGEGRSVLFAALHRIEFDGWSVEEARRATRLLHFRGTFGPNGKKGMFMGSYEPRLSRVPRLSRSAARRNWLAPASVSAVLAAP